MHTHTPNKHFKSIILGFGSALLLTAGSAYADPLNSAQQAVVDYLTDPNVCGSNPQPLPPSEGVAIIGETISARTVTGGPYTCPSSGGPTDAFWADMEAVLNSGNDRTQHDILQSLAFDQFAAAGRLQTELSTIHRHKLSARIKDLKSGSTGIRTAQAPTINNGVLTMDWSSPASGGGASADGSAGPYGAFISARVSTGDRETTSGETGYDIDGYSFTAGLDYRFTDRFVMGAALGYANNEADFDRNAGDMTVDGFSLSVFGTHYQTDSFYIDGIVSYHWNEVETDRNVLQSNLNTLVANSDTDSNIFTASLGLGKEFQTQSLTLSPYLRLDYTDVEIDGFTETGAGFWGMQVDAQDVESLTSNLGIQLVNSISHSWGVLVPQLRVEWVHEYENDSRVIRGRFLGAIASTFNSNLNQPILLPTDAPDEDYFNVAVGTSAQLADNKSWFVQYEGIFGLADSSMHVFQAGLRMEF